MQLGAWAKQNRGSNWLNICLTLLSGAVLWQAVIAGISWSGQAQWSVISDNFRLFVVGRYPAAQDWRLWLLFWLTMCLAGAAWDKWGRWRRDVAGVVIAGFTICYHLCGYCSCRFTVKAGNSLSGRVGICGILGRAVAKTVALGDRHSGALPPCDLAHRWRLGANACQQQSVEWLSTHSAFGTVQHLFVLPHRHCAGFGTAV